jgi:hypothetical protein
VPLLALLTILNDNGLALNKEKGVLAVSELDFLARHIPATGITPSGTTSRSFYFDIY